MQSYLKGWFASSPIRLVSKVILFAARVAYSMYLNVMAPHCPIPELKVKDF